MSPSLQFKNIYVSVSLEHETTLTNIMHNKFLLNGNFYDVDHKVMLM